MQLRQLEPVINTLLEKQAAQERVLEEAMNYMRIQTRFFEEQVKSLVIRDNPSPREWEPTQTIPAPHLKDLIDERVQKGIFHYVQSAPPSAPPPIPPLTIIAHRRSARLRETQQTPTAGTAAQAGPVLFATPAPVIHQPAPPAPSTESEGSVDTQFWRGIRRRVKASELQGG